MKISNQLFFESKKMTPNELNKSSRWGCCFWLLSIFKFAPVLFILAIIGWSYYAYVVELCVFTINSAGKKAIYLLVYHCLVFLLLWSYGQTIFTKTGRIPERFQLTDSEQDRLIHATDENMQQIILKNISKHLPNTNFTIHGGVRYCDRCRAMKPDRAHHCSVCGYCVLKMDHHCPWVNNCISFTNYKFFILFLAYALIYCIFVASTTLEFFFMYWKGLLYNTAKFHVLFLFFVSLMFAISLVSLFIYHCYLLRNNRSTLEAFRPAIFQSGPDKDGFNVGACDNFKQVFGNVRQLWFLPIYTSLGDGITFPHRPIAEDAQELLHNSVPDEVCEFNRHFINLK